MMKKLMTVALLLAWILGNGQGSLTKSKIVQATQFMAFPAYADTSVVVGAMPDYIIGTVDNKIWKRSHDNTKWLEVGSGGGTTTVVQFQSNGLVAPDSTNGRALRYTVEPNYDEATLTDVRKVNSMISPLLANDPDANYKFSTTPFDSAYWWNAAYKRLRETGDTVVSFGIDSRTFLNNATDYVYTRAYKTMAQLNNMGGNLPDEGWACNMSAPLERHFGYVGTTEYAGNVGVNQQGRIMEDGSYIITDSTNADVFGVQVESLDGVGSLSFYKDTVLAANLIETDPVELGYNVYLHNTGSAGSRHRLIIKSTGRIYAVIGLYRGATKIYGGSSDAFGWVLRNDAVPGNNAYSASLNIYQRGTQSGNTVGGKMVISLLADCVNMNPQDSDIYRTRLDLLIKTYIKNGHIPYLIYGPHTYPASLLPHYDIFHKIASDIAQKYGITFVTLKDRDFYGQGLMDANQVHPNNLGQAVLSQYDAFALANLKIPQIPASPLEAGANVTFTQTGRGTIRVDASGGGSSSNPLASVTPNHIPYSNNNGALVNSLLDWDNSNKKLSLPDYGTFYMGLLGTLDASLSTIKAYGQITTTTDSAAGGRFGLLYANALTMRNGFYALSNANDNNAVPIINFMRDSAQVQLDLPAVQSINTNTFTMRNTKSAQMLTTDANGKIQAGTLPDLTPFTKVGPDLDNMVDLNSIFTNDTRFQFSNSDADPSRHYPINVAGSLRTISKGIFAFQYYATYAGLGSPYNHAYHRSWLSGTGWYDWIDDNAVAATSVLFDQSFTASGGETSFETSYPYLGDATLYIDGLKVPKSQLTFGSSIVGYTGTAITTGQKISIVYLHQ